jgi:hypothetical protein
VRRGQRAWRDLRRQVVRPCHCERHHPSRREREPAPPRGRGPHAYQSQVAPTATTTAT